MLVGLIIIIYVEKQIITYKDMYNNIVITCLQLLIKRNACVGGVHMFESSTI